MERNYTTMRVSHDTYYDLKCIFPRLKSQDDRIRRLIELHHRYLGKPDTCLDMEGGRDD